jgi:hypothetical protein
MGGADNAPFEIRGFNIFLKHSPDFIDFFAKRDLVINGNIDLIVQDKGRTAIRKIHFVHARNSDLLPRRQLV